MLNSQGDNYYYQEKDSREGIANSALRPRIMKKNKGVEGKEEKERENLYLTLNLNPTAIRQATK